MFAGRIYKYGAIEIRCGSIASGAASSNLGEETLAFHAAEVTSRYTSDYVNYPVGLKLSGWAKWSLNGASPPTAHFEFALGGLSQAREFEVEMASFSTVLRLVSPALYVNSNGVWEWHVGSVEWEIGGALAGTYSGGVFTSPVAISPLSMPLFTGVLNCQGSSTLLTGAYSGSVSPGNDTHASISASATMGYRVKIGGEWFAFPARLLPTSMPSSIAGSVTTSVDGLAVVTDSHTVVANSDASMSDVTVDIGAVASNGWEVWRRTTMGANRSAGVTVIVDPGFSVQRLNPDYAELIYRGAMPGASARGRYTYDFEKPHPGDPDEYSTTNLRDTEVYLPAAEFLDVVGNETSPLEDVFRSNWSWPALWGTASQASAYFIVPPGTTEVGQDYENPFDVTVADPDPRPYGRAEAAFNYPVVADASGSVVANLRHDLPEVVLLNTVYNPLWSMFLFFPPDGLPEGSANAWKVEGVVADPSDYWLPLREQLARNSHLPAEKNTRDRLQIVTECLSTNGLAGLMASLSGGVTSYWGVSRFAVIPVDPPASVPCSVAGAWSVSGGSLELREDEVRVTPDSDERVTVRLDLFAFEDGVGLVNGLADGAVLGWDSLPEGASLRAFWVTFDRTRVEINLTPGSGDAYAKPQKLSLHYMDSAVEDWSMADHADRGVDLKPTGNSLGAYGDPAYALLNQAFQPYGSNRQYLRLEFEISGTTETVVLAYPRLRLGDGARQLIYDRSQRGALLQANAGPVRWGCSCYFDLLAMRIVDWPLEQESALAPSALDAFGFAHNLEGRRCSDRLASEVAAAFDEGIEYTQLKHLAVDPFTQAQVTHAFALLGAEGGIVLAAVNSYREVPPLAAFPSPCRGPNWEVRADLGFEGKVFSWGQRRRYCAEPVPPDGARSVVLDSSGGEAPFQEEPSVEGWRVWSYQVAAEEVTCRLALRDIPYVSFRPWRGLLWTLGIPPSPNLAAGYDVSLSLRHARSFVPEGASSFWLGTSDNALSWTDLDSGLAAAWARVRFCDFGEEWIGVLYGDGSDVRWARTRDLGETWTDECELGVGTMGDFEEGATGLKWLYKLVSSDGGETFDVWGQLRDNSLAVVRDWTITNVTGVDNAPLGVRESLASDGSWRLGLLVFVGGEPQTRFSKDGLSF